MVRNSGLREADAANKTGSCKFDASTAVQVAVVQYNPQYLNVDSNLAAVEEMLHAIRADLIVLPELFATGYFFQSTSDVRSVAEAIPGGKTTDALQRWSAHTGAVCVGGVAEICSGKLYNSASVVGPEGYIGRYRKLHLYYEEKRHFDAGNVGLPVFQVADRAGTAYALGVMICFDWYYPECARTLTLSGADVICHPANLVRPDCPRAMPIRALENHVFTATANRVGSESRNGETLTFIGQSEICGPDGEVLASMSDTEVGIAVAEFDPVQARDRSITEYNDLLRDRRTDAYIL